MVDLQKNKLEHTAKEKIMSKKFKVYDRPFVTKADRNNCIIVDMDGTLALMDGRSPYDDKRSNQDMPNSPVVAHVNGMAIAYPNLHIIIVSGRHEHAREATIEFLNDYNISFDDLFMRRDDDYRGDDLIKKEIYNNNIAPYYNVLYIVDDRSRVVKMWRKELGLTVFQVDEGDF